MDSEAFGRYIGTLRLAAGYRSQTALSKVSGISNSTIARIEKGETKNPDPATLAILAPYLNIPKEKLFIEAGYVEVEKDSEEDLDTRFLKRWSNLSDTAKKSLLDFIDSLYRDNMK